MSTAQKASAATERVVDGGAAEVGAADLGRAVATDAGTGPPASKPARPMTRVTVLPHVELCPQGTSFDARQGQSLIDALLAHGLAIEHACDKVCACATCHVHVRQGDEALVPADEAEDDQLDAAWGVDAQSRLACCVKLRGDTVVVELPRFTRNHARER
jgi:2Fe-2S ferredoxin